MVQVSPIHFDHAVDEATEAALERLAEKLGLTERQTVEMYDTIRKAIEDEAQNVVELTED